MRGVRSVSLPGARLGKRRRARAPWDDALAKDPQAWERAQAKLVDAKEAAAEAEAVVAAAEAG